MIRELDPALVTLAHEGTKAYADAFDLVHCHEATAPNAVWQADHTELDIWLKDGRGPPEDLLADDDGVAALVRVTGGNFRLLDRLLAQVGRILELNELTLVTGEVVAAAREVLVIGAT